MPGDGIGRRFAGQSPIRLGIASALFALALHLPGLGDGPFAGDDEALDAQVVAAIVHSGGWLFPELADGSLPPKPPLFYWLAAASSVAHGGVDEWGVRLPSALAGAATAFAITVGGVRLCSPGGALFGGLLFTIFPIVRDQARLGRADMVMTLCVTVALLALGGGGTRLSSARRWLFHASVGLAALAKGAAGVGLVTVVLAAELLLGDRRRLLSLAHASLLALLGPAGAWFIAAEEHWGGVFFTRLLLGENVQHFVGGMEGGWVGQDRGFKAFRHRLSHFVNLFSGSAPWGLLLFPVLREHFSRQPYGHGQPSFDDASDRKSLREIAESSPGPAAPRAARPPGAAFLLRWLGFGLLFFTIASRKSPYYLLPILPALALLVGELAAARMPEAVLRGLAESAGSRIALGTVGAVALAGLAVWALGPNLPVDLEDGPRLAATLASIGAVPVVASLSVLGLGLFLGSVAAELRARRPWGAVVAVFLALVLATPWVNRIEAAAADAISLEKFARTVAASAAPEEGIYFLRLPLPAVSFYSGREIGTLRVGDPEPGSSFLVVVPESLEAELPEGWKHRASTVVQDRARVFTRQVMGIRLVRIAPPAGAETGSP